VPEHLGKIGERIGKGWKAVAEKHGLDITVVGPNPLITFSFNPPAGGGKINQALKTLFIQEMLKRGYLAALSVYVSYAHKENHVKSYLKAVDEVFGIIKRSIENKTTSNLLEGPIAHSGFKRLT